MENKIYIGDNLQTMKSSEFLKMHNKINFIYVGFKSDYLMKEKQLNLLYNMPKNVTLVKYFDFFFLYLIFVAMAFLIPKVASIMEFIIIPYYMLTLIICANSSFLAMMVKNIDATVDFYVKVLPFALVFLAGKIMFYFFIRNNRAQIEIQRRRKFDEDNEYKEGPTIW